VDCPIALVVALGQERRALKRSLAFARDRRLREFRAEIGAVSGGTVVLMQAGIGWDRARSALLAASRVFPLRAAWSLGFAGGLADGLRAGDLVCPSVVLLDEGRSGEAYNAAPVHTDIRATLSAAGLSVHDGSVLTVGAPLRTPQAKRAAHRRTGAVAVDMEAVGVARGARSLGVPWLTIKAVVDAVEEPLPEFLAGCTTPGGDLRWRGVMWSLVGSGQRRRTLRRLAQSSGQAAVSLQRALDAIFAAWSP
jgi:nucleoside phosphorylase